MNPIEIENQRPGTEDWRLTSPPNILAQFPPGDLDRTTNRCPIIEGYAWPLSVNIGETTSFFVSTTSPSYSLQVFRMGYYGGLGGRAMADPWRGLTIGAGSNPQPNPAIGSGDASNWMPSKTLQIPTDWVCGCYVAKLEESGGKQSYIFFVVRDDQRASDLLMQCSTTTYHAYNGWGGDSVYGYNNLDNQSRNHGEVIWLKRPYLPSSSPNGRYGAGAGAFFTHDKGPDGDKTWNPNRPDSSMYSCSGWEYNMVRWLESNGYDVAYCTNLDTHLNQLTRSRHRAFLSVGHDEYWSLEAYLNVVNARDNHGVSLLWFSGNTVWNCVDLSQGGTMRVTGNFNPANSQNPSLSNPPVPFKDYSLVGGTWTLNAQANFVVAPDCPAWLTVGTGLQPGNTLGNNMAGYEGNGLQPGENDWESLLPPGMVNLLTCTGGGGSAQAIWYTSRSSGASVASLSSIQWCWGLDDFTLESPSPGRGSRKDAGAERFTKNLIAHCLDAANMIADLPDGIYELRSVSASPQKLIVTNNGDPNGPVVIYGDGTWTSGNSQAKWNIRRYVGPRMSQPIIGPYKAAEDVWYTIRNVQNGQRLIVGDNGEKDGPVVVYGDQYGRWGQTPDNTQMMWRIWRYAAHTTNSPVYMIQNVCNGQLLIVGNNGIKDGPVVVYGNYNGGWGELEDNPQKLWVIAPA
jgi:N,N-dimethylformamidase beta subunit-like, C-terminal